MVPRSFYSLCLHGLIVFGLATKGYAQSPGVLRLPMDQWQMHIGDDERCAAIEANACTVQKFTDDINRYGIEWRRITVTLPPQLLESRQQTALIIQGQQPVYQVFVNGELIGGSGSFSTFTGPLYSRAVFNLPANASADGRLTIAIRVLFIHPSLLAAGFDPAIALLGATQSVMNEDTLAYLKVNWQHYVCFVLLGCTGMVFFLLFSINTRLHEYFWLGALLTLLFSFRLGEFASVVNIGVPSWAGVINYNFGNGIQSLIIVEFVFAFLGRPVPRIFRGLQLIGSLSVLNVFLLAPFVYHAVYPFIPLFERFVIHSFGIAITLANLAQLLVLPMCFRSRLAEMRWIGGAVLFLTVVEGRWQAGWSFSLGFPQYFHLGGIEFDLRPMAWLLFSIVMLIAMTFRLRRIQDRNRVVEQEMDAARSVQQILIPDRLPSIPGLHIESAYLPAQEVGGDFFQILPGGADCEGPLAFIVLGDVSGKGLKAAMTVSMIVGTLRVCATRCTGPAQLLSEINRTLIGRSDGFATCIAMMVEPSGKLTLANAGHPNPYVSGIEIQTEANLPLGMAAGDHYSEITLNIESGQILTLVTDGVIEATNAQGELYGFERTQEISKKSATTIAEAAREFGQHDDITVLTLSQASS